MASGWNLCVWLECIGVVSRCCCKEVYRYPHPLHMDDNCGEWVESMGVASGRAWLAGGGYG